MPSPNEPIKVAYFLQRFPSITRTFIAREAAAIRQHNVDLTIFSLLPPRDEVVHADSKQLLPLVVQSPYFSLDVLKANLYFLLRYPHRYIASFFGLIWQTYHEPETFLKSITLFPKTVFFAREAQKMGCNHIHTHFVYIGAIAANVASKLTGISHSLRPHAFGIFNRNQISARKSLESADRIITISSYHERYIADLCPNLRPEQLHFVHCGLNTKTIAPKTKSSDSGTTQILSIGRAIEKKGHEYLLEACSLLAKKGVDFHCSIVVGEDDGAKKLHELIKKLGCQSHVTLMGDQSQAEIVALYHHCDLFALACVVAKSGDRDGIPSVLIEAMACEVPVVTTDVAGITDLVKHEVNGLLVNERNSEELAEALERLINDKGLRDRLGQQARQPVLDKFDIEKVTKQLAELFRAAS